VGYNEKKRFLGTGRNAVLPGHETPFLFLNAIHILWEVGTMIEIKHLERRRGNVPNA